MSKRRGRARARRLSEFVYVTKVYVPDSMVKGGTTHRLVTDHLGSVRLVIDTATGTIAQRIDYDPWGRILQDTNPGFQPFGFAGGLYDTQTGLVRFGARDYEPVAGRWTRKDPIGFDGSDANLFAMAFAEPANVTDPLGTDALTDDPTVRQYFYDLWRLGGKGRTETERAAWIIRNPADGPYSCSRWPWSAQRRQEKWKGPLPAGTVALAHTHPDSASEKPSTGGTERYPKDDYTAQKIDRPVYVVTRKGIWKVDPQGNVTQEADSTWLQGIEEKTCAKCE